MSNQDQENSMREQLPLISLEAWWEEKDLLRWMTLDGEIEGEVSDEQDLPSSVLERMVAEQYSEMTETPMGTFRIHVAMVGDDQDEYDDSMDGDHDSAMASCGWGTDEDYGDYGGMEDW